MQRNLLKAIILPVFFFSHSCFSQGPPHLETSSIDRKNPYGTIEEIPCPPGFHRLPCDSSSFGYWLRHIRLKADKAVHLYDGSLKANQHAQFAVLAIPVGKLDIQQCADAIMRLRAEYLLACKRYDEIGFTATSGDYISFQKFEKGFRYAVIRGRLHPVAIPNSSQSFSRQQRFDYFLQTVFEYCGTFSLDKELKRVSRVSDLKAGDVFIKGGSPGHAVIVMDVAVNAAGKKLYLLAQSYMPAQEMHVLVNPSNSRLSPWYLVKDGDRILTPEWIFSPNQLKSW